jgi:hypothetical protein
MNQATSTETGTAHRSIRTGHRKTVQIADEDIKPRIIECSPSDPPACTPDHTTQTDRTMKPVQLLSRGGVPR